MPVPRSMKISLGEYINKHIYFLQVPNFSQSKENETENN